VKQQKFDLLHLSANEILNKEYKYEIITRIIKSITRSLYSPYNLIKIPWKDATCRDFLLFVLHLSWFKTYPHVDAKQKNKEIALAQ
jgi:hypothetical protein